MELFTNTCKDGCSFETSYSFFDSCLASNFKVDDEEKVITFDYDFGECGNSLNLPYISDLQSVKFVVKVTPNDIHACVLATYNVDKNTFIGQLADALGVVEFNVRFDAIDHDEQKLMLYYIVNNLLNK